MKFQSHAFKCHIYFNVTGKNKGFIFPADYWSILSNFARLDGFNLPYAPGSQIDTETCEKLVAVLRQTLARRDLPKPNSANFDTIELEKKAYLADQRHQIKSCSGLLQIIESLFQSGPLQVEPVDADCWWRWENDHFERLS